MRWKIDSDATGQHHGGKVGCSLLRWLRASARSCRIKLIGGIEVGGCWCARFHSHRFVCIAAMEGDLNTQACGIQNHLAR